MIPAPVADATPLTDKFLSVVIPCWNEEANIRTTHEQLSAVMSTVTSRYELVFVENGSTDNSQQILREIAAADPHVIVVTLSRNFGAQLAYSCGIDHATGDAVVCIDCDLQDPPEMIRQFVELWIAGNEVVYGERTSRRAPLFLRFAYKAFYRVFRRLSYIPIPLDAGDFALMDRRVIDVLRRMPERNRFVRGLRAWAGFRQVGIPYRRAERKAGKSSNNILGLFRWATTGVVAFSYAPLEMISFLAVAITALAAVGIVVYLALYFIIPDAPRGIETILVVTLFLGAIQLLCLAVISQYLAQIFEEVKGRPRYVVAEVIGREGLVDDPG